MPDGSIRLVMPMTELVVTLRELSPSYGQNTLQMEVTFVLGRAPGATVQVHSDQIMIADIFTQHTEMCVEQSVLGAAALLAQAVTPALQDDYTDATRQGYFT